MSEAALGAHDAGRFGGVVTLEDIRRALSSADIEFRESDAVATEWLGSKGLI
jgi:CBS domain-containing protein